MCSPGLWPIKEKEGLFDWMKRNAAGFFHPALQKSNPNEPQASSAQKKVIVWAGEYGEEHSKEREPPDEETRAQRGSEAGRGLSTGPGQGCCLDMDSQLQRHNSTLFRTPLGNWVTITAKDGNLLLSAAPPLLPVSCISACSSRLNLTRQQSWPPGSEHPPYPQKMPRRPSQWSSYSLLLDELIWNSDVEVN